MKLKNILIYCFLVIAGLSVSCSEDFLDRPPLSEISTENFYQTTDDLRLATAALYGGGPWGEWNYSCYLPVGEVLSGNMAVGYWGDAVQLNTFSITGLNGIMVANWKAMYRIIAHCNTTINAIAERAPAAIPEEDKNAAIAEAKFIRGFAYYNLALLWGDVPIIEDNTKLVTSPLVPRHQVNDVYQFVVNDLTYAAENLPLSDTKGRLTTWSAQGMLAKVYLTWAGLNSKGLGQRDQELLDMAKLYAGNVCSTSGLTLLDNYENLFRTEFNDNRESLFALQWSPGLGWMEGNMLQIYSPGGAEISANGQPGWFGIRPTLNMFELYTPEDSIRRKATFMLRGDYYPELNAAGGGYTFDGDTGLKKHIVGTSVDNKAPTMTSNSSPQHNSLLRLADVYLIYAEAILGDNSVTSDADALFYFNEVRRRAGLAPVTSIDADMLMNERRIELAGESHFWDDLVRLSYYNSPKAVAILNNQQRVAFEYDENGVVTPNDPFGDITPANANTFTFPLPSIEVTANPKLMEPPVPYPFEDK
ncbi:RagB/SusD family nutrient uptake outer membrane protein [Algoriphagus sp.]|uniref:RagB/SusD family nutrient uptake outer membrane protein n=1 Tax=Algoriphagus sp. TaxID=1872435 RepID=UPI003F71C02C